MPLAVEAPLLHVEFFMDPVHMFLKSKEAGRPIYEDREFIKIRFPGDNKRVLVAPANEMHFVSRAGMQMTYAEEYPQYYEAFKKNEADFVSGTPLIAAPFIQSAKRAELKGLNIITVEQLAGLDDRAIKKIGMGARELVEQAKAYMDASGNIAEVTVLREELAQLRAMMTGKPAAVVEVVDPFEHLTEDDLKNMLRDAGKKIPAGRASKATLIAALTEE